MFRPRVIPQLLVEDRGLYKGTGFRKHRYVGDPLNTIKLYNELGVDELLLNDIAASARGATPDFEYLADLASEAFMPLAYGGGIDSLDAMETIFAAGFEKVVLNTAAIEKPNLVRDAARAFGSQSIVLSIDYKKSWLRRKKEVWTRSGRKNTKRLVSEVVADMTAAGAGEIILCSIEHEGRRQGYDLETLSEVAAQCSVPLVASGGAASLQDFKEAHTAGASAVAAGSLFIFQGTHQAVLVNYPDQNTLDHLF